MRSPLEQIWFDVLTEAKIQFQEQVDVGPYQADFLIGKIDLEIDGLQHRSNKKRIDHDIKRDKYFENLGYTVVRVPMNYHKFKSKKQQDKFHRYVDTVLSIIWMSV